MIKKLFIIGILLLSVYCKAEIVYYVDTDVVGGAADGTTPADAYATLNAGLQARETDLQVLGQIVRFKLRGATLADTTPAFADSVWNGNATNYLIIETDTSVSSGRHSGVWSNTCYRLTPADAALTVSSDYTRVIGLQIKETNGGSRNCLTGGSSTDHVLVDKCIYFNDSAGSGDAGIASNMSGGNWNIYNCIFYDFPNGINDGTGSGAGYTIYNCTFHNCSNAVNTYSGSTNQTVIINCIFDNCTTDTKGDTYIDESTSDYNTTTNASLGYTANTHDLVSQTHPFNNPDGGDFSLTSAVAGIDDPGSGLFSDDVSGATRVSPYDRGAWDYLSGGTPPASAGKKRLRFIPILNL